MVGGGNGTVNCGTGCVNRPSGKDRHQRSLREDRIATDRALGELFTEELGAQALDIPLVARKLHVHIVFEGIVRVLRPGSTSSTPTNVRPGQNISKRNQIRKVVSMSLRKSHRR